MQEALFCQALGLSAPWTVERVELDVRRSRIDLYVAWQAKSAACPACGALEQKLHDHRARSWRHLDFFQFEAHVHCQLPRVACSGCGAITQLKVPWAREGSRFTLLFEALGLTLARAAAQAHGGGLELENRTGGGLVARLRIRRDPPVESA